MKAGSAIIFMILIIPVYPIFADNQDPEMNPYNHASGNNNNIEIQPIQINPSTIHIGDTFTITSTLVNNSTAPITLDGGACVPVSYATTSFFTVTLDNHTRINEKNLTCAGVGLSKMLNPGESMTGTSPDSTATYAATEPGTANVTVTFSYHVKNQTDPTQPDSRYIVSKSIQFTVYAKSATKTGNVYGPGGPAVTVTITLDPLQQFRSGVKPEDVKCSPNFLLALKVDYSPACLTESSAEKLLLRGWALGFAHYRAVYFVKPDSTSQISVQYTPLNFKDQTPPDITMQINPRIYKSNSNYPMNGINATARPDLIHTQSRTIVNYTVTTSDAKGVYWLSLEYQCDLIPISVGIGPLQLTPSDLKDPSDSMSCPGSDTQFHVSSISNATLKLVRVD